MMDDTTMTMARSLNHHHKQQALSIKLVLSGAAEEESSERAGLTEWLQ